MLAGKTWDEWISQYAQSHQHPVNRICHTIGIPLIAVSIPFFVLGLVSRSLLMLAVTIFITGWVLQFAGHWYEGKPPEFFRDWRFLLVGLRWWFAKVSGRV